jgi:hypothetical protein
VKGTSSRELEPGSQRSCDRCEVSIRVDEKSHCYLVATDLARSEPFTRPVQWSHVEPLLAEAARTDNQARAVTLPLSPAATARERGKRGADLVLDLEPRAATLPWELLGPAESGAEPLGVRFGVLRQLSTSVRREELVRSRVRRALVIGNPKNVEPSLAGAREEASQVVELFRENGIDVVPCIEKSADETFRDPLDPLDPPPPTSEVTTTTTPRAAE